jgi:predicted nucleic acid-binding protein
VTLAAGQPIVLDTSIVVDLACDNRSGRAIEHKYALKGRAARPLISTVTEGEILAIAKLRKWQLKKQAALQQLLGEFVRVEAGLPQIVENYAELYFEMRQQKQTIDQNDIWIAATARTLSAVVLTSDKHFLWMHPALVQVEYNPRTP